MTTFGTWCCPTSSFTSRLRTRSFVTSEQRSGSATTSATSPSRAAVTTRERRTPRAETFEPRKRVQGAPIVSELQEVIGALQSEAEFEAAVSDLEAAGIDRAHITFLAQEE